MAAPTRFVLIGCGGVGKALLGLLLENGPAASRLSLAAVLDSHSLLTSATPGGALSREAVAAVLEAKSRAGGSLSSVAGVAHLALVASPVPLVLPPHLAGLFVADCTAADTAALLKAAHAAGASLALANKRPLAGPLADFDALTSDPSRLRCCATVGAGLPIHAAVSRLLAAGDAVISLAGALSGTLGFVFSGLQAGQPFSAVVAKAKALGYTEPDPRDDLNGADVGRKALILARRLGWRLEPSDVAVESLVPPLLAGADVSVEAFADGLSAAADGAMAARCADAAAAGRVLRYVARLQGGKASVGVSAVGVDTPLGRLTGADSMVEVTTAVYDATPLVIAGRGAGARATACGVIADLAELADCARR